jgi:hypothetical protein
VVVEMELDFLFHLIQLLLEQQILVEEVVAVVLDQHMKVKMAVQESLL